MPETNTAATSNDPSKHPHKVVNQESDRNVLIYTGYVISALLLLGAVAFHFSSQLIR